MAEDKLPGYTNKSCNSDDEHEQPMNVEKLPPQPITIMPCGHYAQPPFNKAQSETPKKACYDGLVTLPQSVNDLPAHGRNEVEAPRAVHDFTPPDMSYKEDDDSAPIYGNVDVDDESAPIYGNVDFDDDESAPIYGNVDVYDGNDPIDPGETYDVPPKLEDEETYSVPPVPRKGCDADSQETYDIPPYAPPEETYDIPPKQGDGSQETYDVPPKLREYPDEPQETYDVPPGSMKIPTIKQDGILRDGEETYDVPPRERDDIYQNSLPAKSKTEHYSVPQSPYLKRKKDDKNAEKQNVSSLSRGERHSYENVDFDGKPLITS